MRLRLLRSFGIAVVAAVCASASALPPTPFPITFAPGSAAEAPLLVANRGTRIADGDRRGDAGDFWTYSFWAAPGDRCRLELTLTADTVVTPPDVLVAGEDGKPIASKTAIDPNDRLRQITVWSMPQGWPLGTRIPVTITARAGGVSVHAVQFTIAPRDVNADGVPDYLMQIMTQGLPPNTRAVVSRSPAKPYTIFQSGQPASPLLDICTDAVFAYTSAADPIQSWKQRGYTVWTMGGMRESREYGRQHPEEVQTDAAGKPIGIGNDLYLTPTPNRIEKERGYYEKALQAGSDGVCPEEPEYFARGGYEASFKAMWQQQLQTAWQDPASSISARWRASRFMGQLETNQIAQLLQPVAANRPAVRRLVATHSPLHYALADIMSPHYAITSLPTVQEVVGQVWTGTARTPIRYVGLRQDWTFSLAYLEYSSLYQLMRGTGKRLWFLADPLEDDPSRTFADYKQHYEQTLVASLLFPEVDSYEVMPWPERVYGHIPPEYATEINSIVAALQEMHNQPAASGNAVSSANIAALISDSMQWQRLALSGSDLDGLFGMTMPLLQRGVPVQIASLDRAADEGYLRPFKTLLLSYDFQKPPSARSQAALAQWVRDGGCLLFCGGSDAYNALPESWWRQAGLDAPQFDLWNQLGIALSGKAQKVTAPLEDPSRYSSVLKGDPQERENRNRRDYVVDLSSYAQQTGSVAVRFRDLSPADGWGPYVSQCRLDIGGKLAAQFLAGSDLESRFLIFDNGSRVNGQARYADGEASWTYQFDNLPRGVPITLTVNMGNQFEVLAASVKPDFGHTLISAAASGVVGRAFPRLRIPPVYPATVYPQIQTKDTPDIPKTGLAMLYSLRSGGAPVWMQPFGKGLVINVGVAPGVFSANERTAGLLRSLVNYGTRRVGGAMKESDALILRRGKFTIVRTFDDTATIDGRTIDLFSPTLAAAEDREIPARSVALLYDLGPQDAPPHIGYVSGRVQARLETAAVTSFYVRAPAGTPGAARLHTGGRRISGVKALDRLGRSVDVQVDVDGSTALLRYPNDPDGILVRVGWQ